MSPNARWLASLLVLLACNDTPDPGLGGPEPEPGLPADERIEWDPQSQMVQVASTSDCDSWTPTWAPDGNLYTAFGDCRPEGVPQKVGMGFGRISGDEAYAVSFTAIPTGDPADWDDAALGAGVEAVGDDSASHKPGGMLHADGRLWYWIRNISQAGTGVRLKFSDNYNSPTPIFTWADWSIAEVGYASFVQYGQAYAGGPADYVYAVIPMSSSASGSVSNSAYHLVPGFSLIRGSRIDLTLQTNWQYFCGTTSSPAWCASAAASTPILFESAMKFTPRAGMSWNPGISRFNAVAGVRSHSSNSKRRDPLLRWTHRPGLTPALGSVADGVLQRQPELARRHQHAGVWGYKLGFGRAGRHSNRVHEPGRQDFLPLQLRRGLPLDRAGHSAVAPCSFANV